MPKPTLLKSKKIEPVADFSKMLNWDQNKPTPRGWLIGPKWNVVRYKLETSNEPYPDEIWCLGAGYDIFGEYAYGGSTKFSLFDWSRAASDQRYGFAMPTMVQVQPVDRTEVKVFKGESAYKLQTEFSNTVDIGFSVLGIFSSGISGNIDVRELRESRNAYCVIQARIHKWKFAFDPYDPNVLNLLTPQAKEAINSMNPELLFRLYGTHFLNEIITGGRLDYSSYTDLNVYRGSIAFDLAARASFDFGIGSLSAQDYARLKVTIDSFKSSSGVKWTAIGGDGTIIAGIPTGDLSTNRTIYGQWLESIRSNLAFIDFGSRNALQPIWILVDPANPQRRALLETAARQYIEKEGQSRIIYNDSIVDVVVIHGESKSVPVPMGYEKDPYDLNRHAGGDYIYACYVKRSQEEIASQHLRPITDIAVIHGGKKNLSPPAGFDKIGVDCNKGAGGDYIYLCIKRGAPGDITNAVKDVVVVGGDSERIPAPYGYTQIPVDLNDGAGGDYIYLNYRRGEY